MWNAALKLCHWLLCGRFSPWLDLVAYLDCVSVELMWCAVGVKMGQAPNGIMECKIKSGF